MNLVKVGVIDDGYPGLGETRFNLDRISDLTVQEDWGQETSLKDLNLKLVAHSIHWKRKIHLDGFSHPEYFMLNANADSNWNFIAFDWEYGMQQSDKPVDSYLLEVLNTTQAKISIFTAYSGIDAIPDLLVRPEFSTYANVGRLSILDKTDDNSVKTFLDQVETLFKNGETVIWADLEMIIKPSKYIIDSEEFWKLLSILGPQPIKHFIEHETNELTEDAISELLKNAPQKYFIDSGKNILSSSNSSFLKSGYGELKSISSIEAVNIFGIDKVEEAIEKGYTEI
jgi:hypothetical protein